MSYLIVFILGAIIGRVSCPKIHVKHYCPDEEDTFPEEEK